MLPFYLKTDFAGNYKHTVLNTITPFRNQSQITIKEDFIVKIAKNCCSMPEQIRTREVFYSIIYLSVRGINSFYYNKFTQFT